MLDIGGAEIHSFPLVPPPPLPPQPLPPLPPKPSSTTPMRKLVNTTDGLLMTTKDGVTSADMVSTTSSVFHQSTARHDSASHRLPVLAPPQETYIVGPMMYMYFSTANVSDARYTVDLLFQHPSYLKASSCFISFYSISSSSRWGERGEHSPPNFWYFCTSILAWLRRFINHLLTYLLTYLLTWLNNKGVCTIYQ